MRTRRAFLRTAALSALGAPIALGACAQPAAKPTAIPRIGFLSISSEIGFRPFLAGGIGVERKESFLGGMDELGYREGTTIKIDYRWAGSNDPTILGTLADELVAIPDLRLFVAHANASGLALQKRTKLPIVLLNAADPVETGLVPSLSQPGGNVTGMAISLNAMTAKRVELLKEIVPGITTIAYVIGTTTIGGGRAGAVAAAKDLGLRLEIMELRSADELEIAFRKAVDAGVQGIVTGSDAFNQDEEKRILALILRHRLPAVHYFRSYTDDGSVATLKQTQGMGAACAKYVDRILKGASPATLPIEIWARDELIVNPTGGRAIGVEIPPSVMARAAEVVR